MLRVNNLKLPLEGTLDDLPKLVMKKLQVKKGDIGKIALVKKSIDARKKENIFFVCSVEVSLRSGEERILEKKISGVEAVIPHTFCLPEAACPEKRPLIVGAGPAGLFCGLFLARAGWRPIIIERGQDVDRRAGDVELLWREGVLNPESNVQFGEGGAGTFSDGKLNSGINDRRIRTMLEEMVKSGAPPEIIYESRPHIGTDYLHPMVKQLRRRIIELGGEFHFKTKLQDILIENGAVRAALCLRDGQEISFDCTHLILAIGHSARDTFELLHHKGVEMSQKPFAVGLRIEHSQSFIDKAQYGGFAGHSALGAAAYKLAVRLPDGTGVYSFCMCPGGQVVLAASEEKRLVVNGMSRFARADTNANSAILTAVTQEDLGSSHPLAGVEFQRSLEERAYKAGGGGFVAPVQMVEDFIHMQPSSKTALPEPSYLPGVRAGDVSACLNPRISQVLRQGLLKMDSVISKFATSAVLTAVESRSSSPVRILRDDKLESLNVQGLYPIGEGAGYAGGITSSAVDGMRCAESILKA